MSEMFRASFGEAPKPKPTGIEQWLAELPDEDREYVIDQMNNPQWSTAALTEAIRRTSKKSFDRHTVSVFRKSLGPQKLVEVNNGTAD